MRSITASAVIPSSSTSGAKIRRWQTTE
jgi:hypothetical protein